MIVTGDAILSLPRQIRAGQRKRPPRNSFFVHFKPHPGRLGGGLIDPGL